LLKGVLDEFLVNGFLLTSNVFLLGQQEHIYCHVSDFGVDLVDRLVMFFNSLFSVLEGKLPVREGKSSIFKQILASSDVGLVFAIEVHLDHITHDCRNVNEDVLGHLSGHHQFTFRLAQVFFEGLRDPIFNFFDQSVLVSIAVKESKHRQLIQFRS